MSKKVYTKTGDKGYTSLLGGSKVLKNNLTWDNETNTWKEVSILEYSIKNLNKK